MHYRFFASQMNKQVVVRSEHRVWECDAELRSDLRSVPP